MISDAIMYMHDSIVRFYKKKSFYVFICIFHFDFHKIVRNVTFLFGISVCKVQAQSRLNDPPAFLGVFLLTCFFVT